MRSRPRKRRLANAGSRITGRFTERSLWLTPKNEAAPAADTASAGVPPGDTPFGFCAAYGRCLLVEANLCADCGGPDAERIEFTLRGSHGGVKGLAWPGRRRTMERRTGLLGGGAIGRDQLRSRCQQHSASGRDRLPEPTAH